MKMKQKEKEYDTNWIKQSSIKSEKKSYAKEKRQKKETKKRCQKGNDTKENDIS